MLEVLIPAVVALLGVAVAELARQHRYNIDRADDQKALKSELREERETERSRERQQMEAARSAMMADAQKMVDQYQASEKEVRDRWSECEREHRATRDEMNHLAGSVQELRARQVETERSHGVLVAEREKDRSIKHDALTALSVSETAMSTVCRLAPGCTCNTLDPIKVLIESWEPRHHKLLAENRMTVTEWVRAHEQRFGPDRRADR